MSETTTTGSTNGFDFVMYLTDDMKRARAFYESLLGLKPGAIESDYFVEYELPDGNTFAIGHNPSAPKVATGGAMFGVPDAEAAGARAVELGGTFYGKFGGEHCTTQMFVDPDGNPFGLHQRT